MRTEFKEIKREKGMELEVGMGVSGTYWSDWNPFEIVRIISDNTVEVRSLDVEITKSDFIDPEYKLYSNDENSVVRIRKCKQGWKAPGKYGMRFNMYGATYYRDPSF